MIRGFKESDREMVEELLECITVNCRLGFNKGLEDDTIIENIIFEKKNNDGVYILNKFSEDLYIGYISFRNNEVSDEDLLYIEKLIRNSIYIVGDKELRLNINADNEKLVALANQNDFANKEDSPGYEFLYTITGDEELMENRHGLEYRDYQPELIDEYLSFLDKAFQDFNEENDNVYNFTEKKDFFSRIYEKVAELEGFASFWYKGEIVGLYTVNHYGVNMVTFIGVHPDYRGYGFGSYMISYCINETMERVGGDKLYLYTFENNTRAQRFYERNGFVKTAHYYEGIYKG